MTTQIVRLARRQAFALAAVLALVLGMIMFAPTAFAQDAGQDTGQETEEETQDEATLEPITVSNAEFRWGINKETGSRSHDPSAVNMMSAGIVDLTEKRRITQSDWEPTSGNVTLEKRSKDDDLSVATWTGVTTDRSGGMLGNGVDSYSGVEMVFRGGTGEVDPKKGTADIKWRGAVTVLYYQGDSVFTISDPRLKISNNSAEVTATLGGYASDQVQTSLWKKLDSKQNVVIATLPAKDIELSDALGISIEPEYDSVKNPNSATSGSFPLGFVSYLNDVGIGPFFYATGGIADLKKSPLPVSISWDADNPTDVADSGQSKSVLGQVIDDTVEDILRAAGTDISDTAAAWMDEAWKPLQPDAVNAARVGAEAAAEAGAAGEVVSQVDPVFEEYYEEYYAAGAPITAGTVAATVASIPASTSRAASAPASAPASNPADQVTVQMAATSPLYGSDVVYARTSASSEAGGSSSQWQWWVGAALLAIAAVLFFQTVRRKN